MFDISEIIKTDESLVLVSKTRTKTEGNKTTRTTDHYKLTDGTRDALTVTEVETIDDGKVRENAMIWRDDKLAYESISTYDNTEAYQKRIDAGMDSYTNYYNADGVKTDAVHRVKTTTQENGWNVYSTYYNGELMDQTKTMSIYDNTTIETSVDDVDYKWTKITTYDDNKRVIRSVIDDNEGGSSIRSYNYEANRETRTFSSFNNGVESMRCVDEITNSEVDGMKNYVSTTTQFDRDSGETRVSVSEVKATSAFNGYIQTTTINNEFDSVTYQEGSELEDHFIISINKHRTSMGVDGSFRPTQESFSYFITVNMEKTYGTTHVTFRNSEVIKMVPIITQELIDGCRKTIEAVENIDVVTRTTEESSNVTVLETWKRFVKVNYKSILQ